MVPLSRADYGTVKLATNLKPARLFGPAIFAGSKAAVRISRSTSWPARSSLVT
jgi:hypothetical protein